MVNERSRRTEIVDAALALLGEGTVPGLRDVGKAVGMTHAGVLYHVADKRELLVAMLEEQDRRVAPLVDALFARPPLEVLDGLDLFATGIVEHPELSRLYLLTAAAQLEGDGPAHEYVVRRYRELRRRFADALREGQQRGEIRADVDADDVASEIHAVLDGLALQARVLPGETDPHAAISTYRQRLLDSLVP